eukprot:jgi/Astpho2/1172/fgenesh1_pg.00021_%23_20_t
MQSITLTGIGQRQAPVQPLAELAESKAPAQEDPSSDSAAWSKAAQHKLQDVPIWTVHQKRNIVLLHKDPDSKGQDHVALFFMGEQDAADLLEKLKAQDPKLGKQCSLIQTSLDKVYPLLRDSNGRLVPLQEEVEAALKVWLQSRRECYQDAGVEVEAFEGVPLFQANHLTLRAGDRRVMTPLFLSKQDLDAALTSGLQRQDQAFRTHMQGKADQARMEINSAEKALTEAKGRGDKKKLQAAISKATEQLQRAEQFQAEGFKTDPPTVEVGSLEDVIARLEQQTVPDCGVTEDVPAEAVQEAAHPPAAADGEPGEPEPAPEDRHNFALAADGAKLVAANKEAKKAAAILQVDDTFCLTPVKADNWMIIELSQVAKVDTVELSQDELYSSRVKDFELRGRQTHPRSEGTDYTRGLNSTQWKLLGQFRAAKMKGTQSFAVEPTWVKYLQLRLLSHWGMESVCAINDLRVNGKSAAEDLEDRLSIDAPSEEEQDVPSPASAAELASGETAAPVNHAAEQSKPDVGSSQAATAADGGAAGPAAAQNKTASPLNSTGADEGSVAGAEQAEPKPVMLHPGADESPVLASPFLPKILQAALLSLCPLPLLS